MNGQPYDAVGMRRLELTNLKLYDLDTERGTVMVRLSALEAEAEEEPL